MASFISRLTHALAVTITSVFLMAGGLAIAENIQVPLGQQGDKNNAIERPSAGMTKTQVQQRFGEPAGFKDGVGIPPISSWSYNKFTVYFEHDRVIHSVLAHKAI
jgi:hypothetical protein